MEALDYITNRSSDWLMTVKSKQSEIEKIDRNLIRPDVKARSK